MFKGKKVTVYVTDPNGSGQKMEMGEKKNREKGTHNDTEIPTKVKGKWHKGIFFQLLKFETIFQKFMI